MSKPRKQQHLSQNKSKKKSMREKRNSQRKKKKDKEEKVEELRVEKTVLNEAYPEIVYVKPEELAGVEDKNLNIVVIGHVDSGKSTLTGHLLYKLGQVTTAELRKHEKSTEIYGKAGF